MRLRVSSIDSSINKVKLQEMFEEYGDIASIKLFRSLDGSTPALGFVEMKRDRDAQAAMSDLDGLLVGGLCLKVELSSDVVRANAVKPPIVLAPEVDDDDDDDEDDEDDLRLDDTAFDIDEENEEGADEDENKRREVSLDEISDEEY
jgi:RNA recognition motif-containing protein